ECALIPKSFLPPSLMCGYRGTKSNRRRERFATRSPNSYLRQAEAFAELESPIVSDRFVAELREIYDGAQAQLDRSIDTTGRRTRGSRAQGSLVRWRVSGRRGRPLLKGVRATQGRPRRTDDSFPRGS